MSAAAVEELLDALGGRSRARLAAACTEDVHWEDPLSGGAIVGAEALGDHLARFWAAFPDGRVERAADVLADPTHAAAAVLVRGSHTGETSAELPPTGRDLSLHAVLWCALQDGHVHRVRAFFDANEAARQLGVLPARGSLAERALLLLQGFGLRAP
ncbi:MAG TPA: ester cyclase [Baekduia sp.]|nr:ester cyclase [Baekduia sp.]